MFARTEINDVHAELVIITVPENPKRLPSAFLLAAAAVAAQQKIVMYFTGPAIELLARGRAEKVYPMREGKSVANFIKLATDNDVQMIGCLKSLEPNRMTKNNVVYGIAMLTPSVALPALCAVGKALTQ